MAVGFEGFYDFQKFKETRMGDTTVADLVVQLHSNIDSIHQCVESLSDTKDHDVELEKLESEREEMIKELAMKYETEAQQLAEKRKEEEAELIERRRKEDEKL